MRQPEELPKAITTSPSVQKLRSRLERQQFQTSQPMLTTNEYPHHQGTNHKKQLGISSSSSMMSGMTSTTSVESVSTGPGDPSMSPLSDSSSSGGLVVSAGDETSRSPGMQIPNRIAIPDPACNTIGVKETPVPCQNKSSGDFDFMYDFYKRERDTQRKYRMEKEEALARLRLGWDGGLCKPGLVISKGPEHETAVRLHYRRDANVEVEMRAETSVDGEVWSRIEEVHEQKEDLCGNRDEVTGDNSKSAEPPIEEILVLPFKSWKAMMKKSGALKRLTKKKRRKKKRAVR